MRTSTKCYFTLHQGDLTFTYTLVHADGREIFVQTDWLFPSIAALIGWSPCARCRRGCRGQTDGTIDCAAKTALDHIMNAQAFLDRNIGRRVSDGNGVFDFIAEDNDEC